MAFLRCKIIAKNESGWHVQSEIFDGTKFDVMIPTAKLDSMDVKDDNLVWLPVKILGRDRPNGKIAIQLPEASINLGHNVSVSPQIIKTN